RNFQAKTPLSTASPPGPRAGAALPLSQRPAAGKPWFLPAPFRGKKNEESKPDRSIFSSGILRYVLGSRSSGACRLSFSAPGRARKAGGPPDREVRRAARFL